MKVTIKHRLYEISLLILLFLSGLVFFQSVFNFTSMDVFSHMVRPGALALLAVSGAFLLVCLWIFADRMFARLSDRRLMIFTVLAAFIGITIQLGLLLALRPVLRYDHLQVFDGAWEVLQTGSLSLTDRNGYFGSYPFNIAIVLFHSALLRVISTLGISPANSMLALQCAYVFLIDLGIFFAWKIIRILSSRKQAAVFLLVCLCNPVLYVCAAGCYTTTLMIPLLMAVLLLIVVMLKENCPKRKLFFSFLFGVVLVFGAFLRATVLIGAIAFGIYLLIREKDADAVSYSKKQTASLLLAVLVGCVLTGGGYALAKNSLVHEDYRDTQMPPIYYLMFAANPETKGTYSETDYALISSYDTLAEKEKASMEILTERIRTMGLPGVLSLANHKLALTFSDGTEDYRDFLTTSRNYSSLHSLIGGSHNDFFALGCHSFHLAAFGMFLLSLFGAFKKKCDNPRYILYLTLLGGMIFHMLWESYYVYSLGFCMLIYLPAAEEICCLSENSRTGRILPPLGAVSALILFLTAFPLINTLRTTAFDHRECAVVQDMSAGEQLPLLEGETITQTFRTHRPFNRIGCKVQNPTGGENTSLYRMELLSETGAVITSREVIGMEVPDKDYCYMETPLIQPEGSTAYAIRITPLQTDSSHFLTFTCYNSGYYDLYPEGSMSRSLNEKNTDLTFTVFEAVTGNFFHCI